MNQPRIGIVTHYFGRIRVAVVDLDHALALGDRIQFVRRDFVLFDQDVTSMQIQHQSISAANAGQEVAIRVAEPVRAGTEIYFADA